MNAIKFAELLDKREQHKEALTAKNTPSESCIGLVEARNSLSESCKALFPLK